MKTKMILMLLLVQSVAMGAVAAEKSPLGLGFGLGFFDGEPGMMIRTDFVLDPKGLHEIALLAGGFNEDKFTFRIDADYHLVLNPRWKVRVYPLAGAELAIRSKHNRAGYNLGGGLNFDLVEPFRPFVEAKYTFGDWEGFGLVFGVHF
jgi:hypothetical protein